MRNVLLAGVVAALMATAVPASAHPAYHYVGGCGFATLSDGGEDYRTVWTGEAEVAVVATDAVTGAPSPATPISVRCDFYRNGVFEGTILTAAGPGVAAAAATFVYQASPDDVIYVCEEVQVGGETHHECGDPTPTPIIPETWDPVDALIELINYVILEHVDPAVCGALGVLSGSSVPGVLDIAPEGDVHIAGEFIWDCPPYDW